MKWLRQSSSGPLWKEEFSVRAGDERYVTRRQLTKFLVVTSFGMFVGNLWILLRSVFYRAPSYPQQTVARLGEIPVGGVKLFTYPSKEDRCILVRTSEDEHVGYSQKCTHLSCAVYYSRESDRLECPCHKGFFSIADGSVLQGPPSRPLPRIVLENRGEEIVAVDVKV
ncbi:MAG TPA: Rieske 2Fe-2S domain-containing protein [Terriglobales bacterium]|jgi:nitrite reductase/ring-hydroxylating ferredoxin subunit|nr:Rieske 2Fe-2S domain-containing protein [Terriglobales bacterium]